MLKQIVIGALLLLVLYLLCTDKGKVEQFNNIESIMYPLPKSMMHPVRPAGRYVDGKHLDCPGLWKN